MDLRGEAFPQEEEADACAYYEALTVRDSSFPAATQAVTADEVKQRKLAHGELGAVRPATRRC
jgi:alpha,alpha-trehalose phosphorylase